MHAPGILASVLRFKRVQTDTCFQNLWFETCASRTDTSPTSTTGFMLLCHEQFQDR